MATAFKGVMTVKYVDGRTEIVKFDSTDVNLAFTTFSPSGLAFFTMRNAGYIVDIALSAAGVDCSQLALYVNNRDVGAVLLGAGLVATVNNRIPSPIGIAGGATLQIQNRT